MSAALPTAQPAPAEPPAPRWSGWRARTPAAAVVLLGLGALAAQLWMRAGVPRVEDWRAAAAWVESQEQPGDLALLDPPWAEEGRLHLRRVRVEAWPRVEGDDLVRARRVWLVSLRRAPWHDRAALPRDLAAAGAKPGKARRFGGVEVARWDLPERPLAFDFMERLGEATVTMNGALCPKDERGRHVCSPAGWNYVGLGDFEIDSVARRCVWAHPVGPRGIPVTVTWRGAQLGRWLHFRAGLVAATALDRGAAPVEVEVRVDGTIAGEISVASRPGFRSFAVDTSRFAGPGREVSFAITAANHSYRQLCFDAWAE